jgi:hypothetical protein
MLQMLMMLDVSRCLYPRKRRRARARALPHTAVAVTIPGSIFTTFHYHQHLKHVTKTLFAHIKRGSTFTAFHYQHLKHVTKPSFANFQRESSYLQ